ncbi:hypothetical protein X745_30355 [Mesorhizobium sp. LNJC374B00]|nr:hypothetical protein X745_30355 [Mesorhizobium sp. LNJC374B00]
MSPTAGFQNRRWLTGRRIEIAITAIGIGLQNAAPAGEMRRGMFASAIAGIGEHDRRRIGAAERSVIAYVIWVYGANDDDGTARAKASDDAALIAHQDLTLSHGRPISA